MTMNGRRADVMQAWGADLRGGSSLLCALVWKGTWNMAKAAPKPNAPQQAQSSAALGVDVHELCDQLSMRYKNWVGTGAKRGSRQHKALQEVEAKVATLRVVPEPPIDPRTGMASNIDTPTKLDRKSTRLNSSHS